jgi:hypothetical protein
VSQISAPVLPATSEQLALVAALGQRADDARTSWLGMPAVLLEHEGEVLSDELRTRDAAFTGRTESSRSSSGSRTATVKAGSPMIRLQTGVRRCRS